MRDVFGKPIKGPIIPFGSLVEYYHSGMRLKKIFRIH